VRVLLVLEALGIVTLVFIGRVSGGVQLPMVVGVIVLIVGERVLGLSVLVSTARQHKNEIVLAKL